MNPCDFSGSPRLSWVTFPSQIHHFIIAAFYHIRHIFPGSGIWIWGATIQTTLGYKDGKKTTSRKINVVQSLSHIWLFATPWAEARQAPLFFTVSQSLLKLTSIESVMLSNHLILCCLLSPFTLNFSQHQGLFHQVARVSELQLQDQSFQWIVRVDFL